MIQHYPSLSSKSPVSIINPLSKSELFMNLNNITNNKSRSISISNNENFRFLKNPSIMEGDKMKILRKNRNQLRLLQAEAKTATNKSISSITNKESELYRAKLESLNYSTRSM